MKTLLKITAISLIMAVITAFMVISCSPPELPAPHNDWWEKYSEQFDPAKYTDNYGTTGSPSISSSLSAGDLVENNTVTITFPAIADILKKDTVETADISAFISFYTYNAAAAQAAEDASTTVNPNNTVTALNPLTGWSLDHRNGNSFILKMPTFRVDSSKVVIKVDSAAYTHSNGVKIDKDGNGIAGEPGYDDIYATLQVSGITYSYVNPILPANKGWYVTLENFSDYLDGTTDTTTAGDLPLSSDTISGVSEADYNTIIRALAPGFKVEKFSGGSWSVAASASTTDVSAIEPTVSIVAKNFQASHGTAYRVVFEKGSISLETDKVFFGVKQRISIHGSNGNITNNVLIKNTRVEGSVGAYYNSLKRAFKGFSGINTSIYSSDSQNGRIVLQLKLTDPAVSTTTPVVKYYFKQLDLSTFKDNFKIYSSSESSLSYASDIVEIGIEKVEFKLEGVTSTVAEPVSGYNVIYITLDPNYRKDTKNKFFYVGNGFGCADGVTVFSNPDESINKGFKAYGGYSSF